jgi:uncharacterized repeat protein (TIGR03803 family)
MRRFTCTPLASFALAIVLTLVLTQPARAQTYTVLQNFTGGQDGATPEAGLRADKAGNLYGTAAGGGSGHFGCVFRLSNKGSGWILTPLYGFAGGNDGASPVSRVTISPEGIIYGSTYVGGGLGGCDGQGCGTVFNLRPPAFACKTALCPWTETVLYRFTGGNDGGQPSGDLVFDRAGNIYGTAFAGGSSGAGTVFELIPSGGGWTEKVLYTFTGAADGGTPEGGVVFDKNSNLYGTTSQNGAYGCGTVFQLVPTGSSWTETTLYEFGQNGSDGCNSHAGLIFDPSGNLYGTTLNGGPQGGGTVFQLTPSGGGWAESLLYFFTGGYDGGPVGAVTIDSAGSLFGTANSDGGGLGFAFKLTPSNGSWTYTDLHDFNDGDGFQPFGTLILDANGNVYGTATGGGGYGSGVVWEITP